MSQGGTPREISLILANPVFITLMLTILATGSYFFESWLDRKRPTLPAPIKFTSERKPVTLPIQEILYVESNDDITIVYATNGRCFRNITPISRWEAILKPYFIRIHRSYLVNKAAVTGVDVDLLYIGETQLPISRKYKDEVLGLFA
jgi:DNA-binding LytR/AlgR family response regulator